MTSSEPGDSLKREMDEICARFEAEWKSGSAPRIEQYLERLPGDTNSTLLIELLKLDVHYRSENGEPPTADEYTERLPKHATLLQIELNKLLQTISQKQLKAAMRPSVKESPANLEDLSSSRQMGPYKLLQPIGEGGMGQVFMAEQHEPVRRQVALKIIKTTPPARRFLGDFKLSDRRWRRWIIRTSPECWTPASPQMADRTLRWNW
jgi:hypothetical protein